MSYAVLTRAVRKVRGVGRRVRWRLRDALAPRGTIRARGLSFTLQCDNWITQFRMDTFETKEPETLDWIDAQVGAADVLFDVGGNIGVYSLYAVLRHRRATVIVFEPEYANLHLLRDNVVANGLAGRIQVYPIAVSDRTGVSQLHVQDLTPGAALHSESRSAATTTESGEAVVTSEGTWAMRLDDFCNAAGCWPNAMKIDVDGGEGRVLVGAKEALSRSTFRTVLVEAGQAGLPPGMEDFLLDAGLHRLAIAHDSESGNQVWIR